MGSFRNWLKSVWTWIIQFLLGRKPRFVIYKDPVFKRENGLIGYKGSTILSAGYIFAPYVPLGMTYDIYREAPGELAELFAKELIRAGFRIHAKNGYLHAKWRGVLAFVAFSDDHMLKIRQRGNYKVWGYNAADPNFNPAVLVNELKRLAYGMKVNDRHG